MTKRFDAVRPPSYLPSRLRYLTPIEIVGQTETFLRLNGKDRKGFRPSDIPSIPLSRLRNKTSLLVLAVYFESLEETFNRWWGFMEPPPGMIKYRVNGFKTGPEYLRLAPGIDWVPGIRWVEFNPGANRGITAEDALAKPLADGVYLAHAEGIMAAAEHKRWVEGWNGTDSPYPSLSGLQSRTSTGWSDTPFLNSWDATGQNRLILGAWGASTRLWCQHWASPEVRAIES